MITTIINLITEALQFSFFQKSLVVGLLTSIVFGALGVFVVLRKEANIVHTLSNSLLLWVVLGLIFQVSSRWTMLIVWVIAVLFLSYLQDSRFFHHDSINEIVWHASLATAIVALSMYSGYVNQLESLLFGDILAISTGDIYSTLALAWVIIVFTSIFYKPLIGTIISPEIAASSGYNVRFRNIALNSVICISIAISIEILWVMLIAAFLIIWPNVAKLFCKSLRQVFIFSMLFTVIFAILWLFTSYILDAPSWASIVLFLFWWLIWGLFIKSMANFLTK